MFRIKSEIWRRRRRRRHRWYGEQTRHDRRKKLTELFLVLVGLAAANVIAMIVFEGLSVGDAIWLTMTTITTVGYGDISAVTTSRSYFDHISDVCVWHFPVGADSRGMV